MVTLYINGENMTVPATIQTISELIDHLELKSPFVIVEHNQVILKNDQHENTTISNGDKVELVQFVGGG